MGGGVTMTNEEKAFKLTPQEFISLYQSNPKPINNEEKNCKSMRYNR